jgi:hypothetical protein
VIEEERYVGDEVGEIEGEEEEEEVEGEKSRRKFDVSKRCCWCSRCVC